MGNEDSSGTEFLDYGSEFLCTVRIVHRRDDLPASTGLNCPFRLTRPDDVIAAKILSYLRDLINAAAISHPATEANVGEGRGNGVFELSYPYVQFQLKDDGVRVWMMILLKYLQNH